MSRGSDEPVDGEMERISFPDGHAANVPRDSVMARVLVEAAIDERARVARGEPTSDPWTMGPTAHLLWVTSPASRPHLKQLVCDKFQAGIDLEETPLPLYSFEVTGGVYMTEVLEPLLAGWPRTRVELNRELEFLRAAAAYHGRHAARIRADVRDFVGHWLAIDATLNVIAEVDHRVADFIRDPRWEGS